MEVVVDRFTRASVLGALLVAGMSFTGCGDDDTPPPGTDAGAPAGDSGMRDAGPRADAGATADAGAPLDAGAGADAAAGTDAGPATDAGPRSDAGVAIDAGPRDAGGSGGTCTRDTDCTSGSEWCEGGRCVACDNSGLLCDIACGLGWSTYMRNGCSPCACAPPNPCVSDSECAASGGGAQRCYAGAFCWDWCPPGDPSCCFGNVCSAVGCADPHPGGCRTRGCPLGQTCDTSVGCVSSACSCVGGGGWVCTDDCGGGTCVP